MSPDFTKEYIDNVDPANDLLRITPLGAGQEVGRSCIILEFKSKKIMLDCGIHPAYQGILSLPYFDYIDPVEIDIIFITHFHLDHCGALPWFLTKTYFKGRVFMTHATKAIYKWLLSDFIRVSCNRQIQSLFSEKDLENSLDRIETVHFHQETEACGMKFTSYHAGHVLGACMFLIEIAGIKILYTGDFSRQEDRHLVSAEIPNIKPDVLIMESTYGIYVHEKRETRETRFTNAVRDIVTRGGRCLIPSFALGRAQEQLLILDQYWEENKLLLAKIPIYYASSLANKCMAVYQTYSGSMNQRMQEKMKINNPFKFKNISFLKGMEEFNDSGPCVILASPGMLQDGFSRDLFELWCSDHKNGVIIAGYSVDGTLAKDLISEPEQVMSITGRPLQRKCSVEYISFSAHADYNEFKEMVEGLMPSHIVLVHGEANEMMRLKNSLTRDLTAKYNNEINIHNPRNTTSLDLFFKGELIAKVFGRLVPDKSYNTDQMSGVIVKNGFSYNIFSKEEIQLYSDMKSTTIRQKLLVPFPNDDELFEMFIQNLGILHGRKIRENPETGKIMFDNIEIIRKENSIALLWLSDVIGDAMADTVVALIGETSRTKSKVNDSLRRENRDSNIFKLMCLNFGDDKVTLNESKIIIKISEEEELEINLTNMEIACKHEYTKNSVERKIFHYMNSIENYCRCSH